MPPDETTNAIDEAVEQLNRQLGSKPPADEAQQYAEAVEMFDMTLDFIGSGLSAARIEQAFHASVAARQLAEAERAEVARLQRETGASLMSIIGKPPIPGATVSAPTGRIMADPAWVFRRDAAPDAPQIAEDGPGEASGPAGRVD